jgi:hypothetical protein
VEYGIHESDIQELAHHRMQDASKLRELNTVYPFRSIKISKPQTLRSWICVIVQFSLVIIEGGAKLSATIYSWRI